MRSASPAVLPASPTHHVHSRVAATDNPRTPSAPRTDSRGASQRVIAGGSAGEAVLHAPRPLSERAMIPLDLRSRRARLRQGDQQRSPLSPLRPGPLSSSSSFSSLSGATKSDGRLLIPLSPLRLSPMRVSHVEAVVASPCRTTFADNDAERVMEPSSNSRGQSQREAEVRGDGAEDSGAVQTSPREQIRLDSMLAHDGEETDSDGEVFIGPGAPSPRMMLELQSRLDGDEPSSAASVWGWDGSPLRARRPPPRAACYMCPEPCQPGAGLCDECQRRFQPRSSLDMDASDSEYEDVRVRTPSLSLSLSPRKAKPLSTNPSTPTNGTHRQHRHQHSGNTARTSSPEMPATPRGWSRISTSGYHQQEAQQEYSKPSMTPTGMSPTTQFLRQLKVFPSPPPRRSPMRSNFLSGRHEDEYDASEDDADDYSETSVELLGGEKRSSALYHLERSMKLENWQPLKPGAEPWQPGHDVVRVGSVSSPRVVVRNSDAENADTMKMLADEALEEHEALPSRPVQQERRHQAGGSYGDWFSLYAEREGNHEAPAYDYACASGHGALTPGPASSSVQSPGDPFMDRGLHQRRSNRYSTASSIYDRIQSIYDAYADLSADEEDGTGEVELF